MELLHDAEEGFLGFDCISPLKAVLGPGFKTVSDRLLAAVVERYSLPAWTAETHRLHKDADHAAAAAEAVHCVGWSREEVQTVLQIQSPVLDRDPLAERYGVDQWRPWTSDVAADRFLGELRFLVASRAQAVSGAFS